ncbi:MAG: CehA/McbA family metallohydrolase [Chloroflexota bacterium]|nr:CehA/McbA family metallohydrolase [Chloroflexota bacterium]
MGNIRSTTRLACEGVPATLRDQARPDHVIVIQGRRGPEEAMVSAASIRYLPFDVPEGVTRIHVRQQLEHGADPKQRGNIDLGLFDPRGYAFGGPGFRGWQGGMPGDLVLTGDIATSAPWYIPGPIPAGRWHLGQWFITSAPAGVSYTYTITLSFDGPKPPERMPDVPTYDLGVIVGAPGWYAGNLHAHTIHSDGRRTLEELVEQNRAAGFHFLAPTDHNATRPHYHFAEVAQAHPDHLLLAGVEVTSPYGHANIIGQYPGHWFDFRIDGGDGRLPGIITEAHRQGAVVMLNHPFATCTTCAWRFPMDEWSEADAIEVWNGAWTPDDRLAVDWWDSLLKIGRRIHAYGGTDYHGGDNPLVPAIWVYANNLSQPAIMEGLRLGRTFLSEGPNGPKLYLTARGEVLPGGLITPGRDGTVPVAVRVVEGQGLLLRLVWATGEDKLSVKAGDVTLEYAVPVSPTRTASYVRVELLYPDGRVAALTNPIYIR